MSKHTPAPWQADDFLCDNEHALRIAMPDRNGVPTATIAFCEHNWNDCGQYDRRISWAEAEANARLIAASPTLLEAVIQYRDDLKRPPTGDSIERRLAMVNAAIAKANGAAS